MYLKSAVLATAALMVTNSAMAADICKGGPKDQWLSQEQIGEKLATMGHSKFVLAVEDGCLEAKVLKDGKRLEIYMEPLTGEVVKVKED
jgi:hypothetical protein